MSQDEIGFNLSQESTTFNDLPELMTGSQMQISSQEVPNAFECSSSQNDSEQAGNSQEMDNYPCPDAEPEAGLESRVLPSIDKLVRSDARRRVDSRSFSTVLKQEPLNAEDENEEKPQPQRSSHEFSQSSMSTADTRDGDPRESDPTDIKDDFTEGVELLQMLSGSQPLEEDAEFLAECESQGRKGGLRRSHATSSYGRQRKQPNYMDMAAGKRAHNGDAGADKDHAPEERGDGHTGPVASGAGGGERGWAGEADGQGGKGAKGRKVKEPVKRERKRAKTDAGEEHAKGMVEEVTDEANDETLAEEEKEVARRYGERAVDVQFGELMIQTSNIKVSFTFGDGKAVSIDQLCDHLEKDEFLRTASYTVKVKGRSATVNNEGRTYFGGVFTITMDVWSRESAASDDKELGQGSNSCVRLFGFKDSDPEKRHKAQFNGCSKSFNDTLTFFREVFGVNYHMKDLRVEPNSVFSATDNAVMDPAFGLDMDALEECLKRQNIQNNKSQVTGGVNFSFNDASGRQCKPTVQKSGSVQLMLVDAPRRIRLETMRFLLDHCSEAIVPLKRLGLTRRTVEKRVKARNQLLKARAALEHKAANGGSEGVNGSS